MAECIDQLVSLCDLTQLTEEIGKLEDKVECANKPLKADWERWKQNMQNDIKSAFTNMAEENILYYEQVNSDAVLLSFFLKVIPLSLTFCLLVLVYSRNQVYSFKSPLWWLSASGAASQQSITKPTHN